MRYIGSPFYFSFTEIAKGMSMASPNSAVTAAGSVYFMDRGEFYIYAGSVKRLPCPVLSTVFDDFDIRRDIRFSQDLIQISQKYGGYII